MSDDARREDVEAKQKFVAELLGDLRADGLLVLDPANVRWLTAGAESHGLRYPDEEPALFYTPESRWLLCSNVDSRQIFDEQIDGLGFQLKEWPWHWGREQFLADLCHNRKVACDTPRNGLPDVADRVRQLRRSLTPYDEACYRALGQILAHALEATCRTCAPGAAGGSSIAPASWASR